MGLADGRVASSSAPPAATPSTVTSETDDTSMPSMSPGPSSLASNDESSENEKRKQRNRLAERKSRMTRKTNRERMVQQVQALECVLANLMFVGDDKDVSAAGWGDLVLDDDESKRVREFLRRLAPLEAEKARLASQQSELRHLLKDREAFEDLFYALVEEMNKENDWEWKVLRWRALTLASFEPWSKAKCDTVTEDTMNYITNFMAKDDVVTTGLSFLGWRDRRRLDKVNSAIEFSFYKTCQGNVDVINDGLWRLQRPGKAYAEIIVGRNVKVHTELLQEIDENRCLIRVAEQLQADSPVVIHMIVLLMRIFVGDACYIVRRAVSVPEVEASFSDPDAVWASVYYWTSHLVLDRNPSGTSTKYLCSTCGTISSQNPAYAVLWLSEVLFSVIRGESWIRGTQFLLT